MELKYVAVGTTEKHKFGPEILGKAATEAFHMMQEIDGDDTLSRSVVFRWHRCFSFFFLWRGSLEDDVRTGQPQTVRTERMIEDVEMLVGAKRSQSVHDFSTAVGSARYVLKISDL